MFLELGNSSLEAFMIDISGCVDLLAGIIEEGKSIGLGDLEEFDIEIFSGDLFLLELDQVLVGGVSVVFVLQIEELDVSGVDRVIASLYFLLSVRSIEVLSGDAGSSEITSSFSGEDLVTPFEDVAQVGELLNGEELLMEGFSADVLGISVFHPVDGVKVSQAGSDGGAVDDIIGRAVGSP